MNNALRNSTMLVLAAFLVSHVVAGEGKGRREEWEQKQKEEAKIKTDYIKQKQRTGQSLTDDEKKYLEKVASDKDYAEHKEKIAINRANIKDTAAKAEELWKNKKYGEASTFYKSITLANVTGSDSEVENARQRLIELEDLAKKELIKVEDLDLQGNYAKEVEILHYITKEFRLTDTCKHAESKLRTLTSRPDVAGLLEVVKADDLQKDGKYTEAVAAYERIINTPRYDNTLSNLQAKRALEALKKDESALAAIKAEHEARAQREAPKLISSAKNYMANEKPKLAEDCLRQVVEKFPGTQYAEDAQKLLDSLTGGK